MSIYGQTAAMAEGGESVVINAPRYSETSNRCLPLESKNGRPGSLTNGGAGPSLETTNQTNVTNGSGIAVGFVQFVTFVANSVWPGEMERNR